MAKLFAVCHHRDRDPVCDSDLARTLGWRLPDISTHGHLIDEQMSETMAEAGIAFLAAQFFLAFFIWQFSNRGAGSKDQKFPGGAKGLVHCRLPGSGRGSIGSWSFRSEGMGRPVFNPTVGQCHAHPSPSRTVCFLFPLSRSGWKFGPHSSRADQRGQPEFLWLDPTHDPDSKDDIVTAEMAIPVNKEIHLLMHSKDLGHSFFVRELRVQQDFVPGLDVSLHFTATKVGKYEIVCTQLCGLGHYNMKAYLEVMSQQDFDDWLKKEAAMQ